MFMTIGDEVAVDATRAIEDAYAAHQEYYQQQYAQQQQEHPIKLNPFAN